jgi:hypothetical protein
LRWITRERARVGRIGCAWLITRFIDPEAELFFVPGAQLAPEAERLGATIFHEHGSGLDRRGDVSSFEAVIGRYGLGADPALGLLAQIVNTADIKTSPYKRPEGAGLRATTDGLLVIHPDDDHALCEIGFRVYDALYAYCGELLRAGRAG